MPQPLQAPNPRNSLTASPRTATSRSSLCVSFVGASVRVKPLTYIAVCLKAEIPFGHLTNHSEGRTHEAFCDHEKLSDEIFGVEDPLASPT